MCVNDLITLQAEPLFFLDYLVTEKIDLKKSKLIFKGITKGCRESYCSLIGGETAEHPNAFPKGKFDLAGFCVGVMEKNTKKLKNQVKKNDVLIGLKSSGLHSNGFSLIRKLVENKKLKLNQEFNGSTLGKVLLKPTKIYVKEILLLKEKITINALSHITGGGLIGNLERVIPNHLIANIHLSEKYSFNNDLYSLIETKSNLSKNEMLSTFNCGIGMILSINKKDLIACKKILKKLKMPHVELGYVGSNRSNKKISIIK